MLDVDISISAYLSQVGCGNMLQLAQLSQVTSCAVWHAAGPIVLSIFPTLGQSTSGEQPVSTLSLEFWEVSDNLYEFIEIYCTLVYVHFRNHFVVATTTATTPYVCHLGLISLILIIYNNWPWIRVISRYFSESHPRFPFNQRDIGLTGNETTNPWAWANVVNPFQLEQPFHQEFRSVPKMEGFRTNLIAGCFVGGFSLT